MKLGDKIKTLRAEKGIERAELAETLGITYHALSKYETNEREPDYETVKKLADYFGVTTDYLLGRTLIPYIEIEIDGVETLEDARALGKKIGEEIAALVNSKGLTEEQARDVLQAFEKQLDVIIELTKNKPAFLH